MDLTKYKFVPEEVINSDTKLPKKIKMSFIEPGLVAYPEHDMTLLADKKTLDMMMSSLVGKPIYNYSHKEAKISDFKSGKADGIISTNVWFNAEDGKYWCEALIWDKATAETCESGVYFPSCAYVPQFDDSDNGGTHNNLKFDKRLTGGEYTHIAIVPNPRYEDMQIICNSKTGGNEMNLKFWSKSKDKEGKEVVNSIDLNPETTIDIDGSKVALKTLIALHNAKAISASLTDDSIIEVDGKTMTLKDLKNSYMKDCNNESEEEKKKDEEKKEKQNAEEEKKKKEEEKKNAEAEEKKKKEDEEKKNAEAEEEKKKKEEEEKKNAEDKEKEKEKEKEKQNSSGFDALKNANAKRGEPIPPANQFASRREKAQLGKANYSSNK